MKRILLLLATVSVLGMANTAMAQADRSTVRVDRAIPGVERVTPRAAIDTTIIADRLRARGVPEASIDINLERIRAAIQSGNYPNLLRRLYNAGLIGGGGSDQDPNRRRYLSAGGADEVGANRRRVLNAAEGNDAATERRRLQAGEVARVDRAVRGETSVRVGRGD